MIAITIISFGINITSLTIIRSIKFQHRSKVEFNFILIRTITSFVKFLEYVLSSGRVAFSENSLAPSLAGTLPFISDVLSLMQS
ncbi:hypothetical protein CRE_03380 [Caenorhabditis remanei]|uniref:Serpentine receptor class gamma n=1 Tax=Caenorhabditis remanei TaxID=31234 RepID=E3N647_CAERE|nr:hypothetical protein CRE_03380 [Caenorhabditis remanei]